MPERNRRLWLIDAAYLFNAQRSVAQDYQFDYVKPGEKLEEVGPIWRAYYLNSTPNPPTDEQDAFTRSFAQRRRMAPRSSQSFIN